MRTAAFVLSTGRCGTQWLAENLRKVYGDVLTVEHEPLDNGYQPRRLLGLRTPLGLDPSEASVILDHVEGIERGLETRPYLECGHPCWSTVPWLSKRFAGKIRVLHLTRHPIPTALSWLTQMAFEPPLLPHLREKVLLSPFDDGVSFPECRERWPAMSSFEKCLYYWAEVNALGLRLEQEAGVPWLRISFEELFAPSGIRRVLAFLGLDEREDMIEAGVEIVDAHHSIAASPFPDLGAFSRHPRLVEVASRLNYPPSWEDIPGLRKRHVHSRF